MSILTGDKSYQCDTCDAKFFHKPTLTQHMRIRTGEKPFHCKMCGATFSQNGNLKRHILRHIFLLNVIFSEYEYNFY